MAYVGEMLKASILVNDLCWLMAYVGEMLKASIRLLMLAVKAGRINTRWKAALE